MGCLEILQSTLWKAVVCFWWPLARIKRGYLFFTSISCIPFESPWIAAIWDVCSAHECPIIVSMHLAELSCITASCCTPAPDASALSATDISVMQMLFLKAFPKSICWLPMDKADAFDGTHHPTRALPPLAPVVPAHEEVVSLAGKHLPGLAVPCLETSPLTHKFMQWISHGGKAPAPRCPSAAPSLVGTESEPRVERKS